MNDYDMGHYLNVIGGVLISFFPFYLIIRRGLRYAEVVCMICIIVYFYDFFLFLFHPIIRRGARLAEVICPH